MSPAHAVAAAVMFGWLGMVVAISFIEAPQKFRAPGVSLQVGLGIGRLVFRALNTVEAICAATVLVAIATDPASSAATVAVAVAVITLAAQLFVVRPQLSRRSDAVLATPVAAAPGESLRRSRAHYGYVALEIAKVAALVVAGSALLTA